MKADVQSIREKQYSHPGIPKDNKEGATIAALMQSLKAENVNLSYI